MSTIDTVIGKLETLITENHVEPKVENAVKEILSLLKDRTVLLIEWNGIDIQKAAREIIAFSSDFSIDDIIANPLPKDDVEWVIARLDKYYDCNYGITWDSIRDALNEVSLPKAENCLVDIEPVCEWTREIGTEDRYETECGNEYDYGTNEHENDMFKFCPYCGKKIKEAADVGDKEKE